MSRFPLDWPEGKRRTPPLARRAGKFKVGTADITFHPALKRLEKQLELLGAEDGADLSSNYRVRLDGSPVLNQGAPSDPGVCIRFRMKGKLFAMAADAFTDVAQNIAALAAHISAVRDQERYGVATAADSLQTFAALPGPGARPWWGELGYASEAAILAGTRAEAEERITRAYRHLARNAHPDNGGSDAAMAEVNAARDAALQALAARSR